MNKDSIDHAGMAITRQVTDLSQGSDARLKAVMKSLIRHLHGFVTEVGLTEAEWMRGIDFLTQAGRISVDGRQELILLSDVLGVSMLVDQLNHPADGAETASTVFGPFYTGEQPERPSGASLLVRPEPGAPALHIAGRVLDPAGSPIEGAKIEVWQTAPNGLYDVQDDNQPPGHLRGTLRADAIGSFRFTTIMPVSYAIPDDGPVGTLLKALNRHPWRPAHIHFMISAPGYRRLVTHLFLAGDRYLESDAVFGVKPELIVAPEPVSDGFALGYDFVLALAVTGG